MIPLKKARPGTRFHPWYGPGIFLLLIGGFIIALPWLPAITARDSFYGLRTDSPVTPLYSVNEKPVIPPQTGLTIVFFGYLQCGTVCLPQITNLISLQEQMASEAVNFVFVSIDPERDSAERLQSATRQFGPAFTAVRPESAAEAQTLARKYHDFVRSAAKDEHRNPDHAGHLHVVTPAGRRELVYTSANLDLNRVTQDLRRLLAAQELSTQKPHTLPMPVVITAELDLSKEH